MLRPRHNLAACLVSCHPLFSTHPSPPLSDYLCHPSGKPDGTAKIPTLHPQKPKHPLTLRSLMPLPRMMYQGPCWSPVQPTQPGYVPPVLCIYVFAGVLVCHVVLSPLRMVCLGPCCSPAQPIHPGYSPPVHVLCSVSMCIMLFCLPRQG